MSTSSSAFASATAAKPPFRSVFLGTVSHVSKSHISLTGNEFSNVSGYDELVGDAPECLKPVISQARSALLAAKQARDRDQSVVEYHRFRAQARTFASLAQAIMIEYALHQGVPDTHNRNRRLVIRRGWQIVYATGYQHDEDFLNEAFDA